MIWENVKRLDSENKNVWKYVFERSDAVAEAVLYRYPTFTGRTVICCSTQSGCPVGCRFCGAGDSFVRSLTSDEIVGQVARLIDDVASGTLGETTTSDQMEKLQVMFMSMGEPLLNRNGLVDALERLYKLYPNAKLLISTSAPAVDYSWVREVSQRIPTIGLQFSVHESTDEARNALIPFESKLNLVQIAAEGTAWASATGRRPFFNYCAHSENVSDDDVKRLYDLFDPAVWECTVSVICEREEHVAAANARQRDLAAGFMEKMMLKGFSTRMFDPAGQDDIGGGCGQLWYVQNWMNKNNGIAKPSIGHKRLPVHTPR